jgi:tetratricopeptide (TPR) repeat protein
MRDEDHGSTPHRTVYEGFNELFADLRLPGDLRDRAAIEAHYRALSERFRFPLRPSESSLTELGYELLGENQDHQSVGVFRLLVDTYPESANAYDSLGEALEKIGEPEQALENYELAVERATAQEHQLLELFVRNRDRLRDQLSESTP